MKVTKYTIKTCDSTFVGTLEECRSWLLADSFAPWKAADMWDQLVTIGKISLGFPWGEVGLRREV